jgi:hypothetical protein
MGLTRRYGGAEGTKGEGELGSAMKSNRQNEHTGQRKNRPDGLRRAAMTKEHIANEEH